MVSLVALRLPCLTSIYIYAHTRESAGITDGEWNTSRATKQDLLDCFNIILIVFHPQPRPKVAYH